MRNLNKITIRVTACKIVGRSIGDILENQWLSNISNEQFELSYIPMQFEFVQWFVS